MDYSPALTGTHLYSWVKRTQVLRLTLAVANSHRSKTLGHDAQLAMDTVAFKLLLIVVSSFLRHMVTARTVSGVPSHMTQTPSKMPTIVEMKDASGNGTERNKNAR